MVNTNHLNQKNSNQQPDKKADEVLNEHSTGTIRVDEFLNISEVSKLVGLEESTLYGLTSKRKIPHYKPGKKLLFKRSEILAWIDKSRQATADEIINQSKTESNG